MSTNKHIKSALTVEDIRDMRDHLVKMQCPASKVKSQEEVDEMNEFDKEILGIDSNWKIGDDYYWMPMNPDAFKI